MNPIDIIGCKMNVLLVATCFVKSYFTDTKLYNKNLVQFIEEMTT